MFHGMVPVIASMTGHQLMLKVSRRLQIQLDSQPGKLNLDCMSCMHCLRPRQLYLLWMTPGRLGTIHEFCTFHRSFVCRQDSHAWDQPLLMLMSDPDLPFYQGEFGVGQAGPFPSSTCRLRRCVGVTCSRTVICYNLGDN